MAGGDGAGLGARSPGGAHTPHRMRLGESAEAWPQAFVCAPRRPPPPRRPVLPAAPALQSDSESARLHLRLTEEPSNSFSLLFLELGILVSLCIN